MEAGAVPYLSYFDNDDDSNSEDDQDTTLKSSLDLATGLMSYFEPLYTCSGICSTPMFFYSLGLSHGIPRTTCLYHLKAEINDSLTYIGVTALLAFAVLFMLWVAQYCLWK